MGGFLSSLTWRKTLLFGACLLLGGGALAVMVDSNRDKAIEAAKQHGSVDFFNPLLRERLRISLRDTAGFDKVLPLLKDVRDLEQLTVGTAELREKDLRAISELSQLKTLFIYQCNVSDDGLHFLKNLATLRELRLSRNPITDEGLQHLAPLKDLETLDLSSTQVRGPGLKYVTPSLTTLSLNGSLVDDETIVYCTRFRHLARLEFLDTKVTESGLMKLTDLHWLTTLGSPNEIPRDAKRRFHAAYLESLANAAAAGGDVPRDARQLPPYE